MTEAVQPCAICDRPTKQELCAHCRGAQLLGVHVIEGLGEPAPIGDTVFAGRFLPPVPPSKPKQ